MSVLFSTPLKQGDTWSFDLGTIVDRAGTAVTDLTGWTARFTMRPRVGAAVTNQTAGTISAATFTWEIAKATTASIAAGVYVGDIEVTDPSGRTATPASGIITVLPDTSP